MQAFSSETHVNNWWPGIGRNFRRLLKTSGSRLRTEVTMVTDIVGVASRLPTFTGFWPHHENPQSASLKHMIWCSFIRPLRSRRLLSSTQLEIKEDFKEMVRFVSSVAVLYFLKKIFAGWIKLLCKSGFRKYQVKIFTIYFHPKKNI